MSSDAAIYTTIAARARCVSLDQSQDSNSKLDSSGCKSWDSAASGGDPESSGTVACSRLALDAELRFRAIEMQVVDGGRRKESVAYWRCWRQNDDGWKSSVRQGVELRKQKEFRRIRELIYWYGTRCGCA